MHKETDNVKQQGRMSQANRHNIACTYHAKVLATEMKCMHKDNIRKQCA